MNLLKSQFSLKADLLVAFPTGSILVHSFICLFILFYFYLFIYLFIYLYIPPPKKKRNKNVYICNYLYKDE